MKSLNELLPAGECVSQKLPSSTRVLNLSDQSQQICPGDLYFAIRGTKFDGHKFIDEALEKGAVGVVLEDPSYIEAARNNAILVRSTRKALALAWARWLGNPSRALKIVGVTGTNGKTTTTYLLKQVWETLGFKTGVVGTVATLVGNEAEEATHTTPHPRTLQQAFRKMVDAEVTHAAVEVTSIAIDQERTAGSHFDVGIFSNLTQDHLDYHGSMEAYFEAKARFFTEYNLPEAVINLDDAFAERFLGKTQKARVQTFSIENARANFYFEKHSMGKEGLKGRLVTPSGKFDFFSPLVGRYNLHNALGVVAACFAMGLEMKSVIAAIEKATGAPGRLERVGVDGPLSRVFVDYAHTPDALEKVLTALRGLGVGEGRLITVFGCGGDRDRTKRPQMGKLVSELSDFVITTSDNPRTEDPEKILNEIETGFSRDASSYLREVDRRKAIHRALEIAEPEDLVLVAGKGHETYQILGENKIPFDDRVVIRDYYESREHSV